MTLLDHVGHAPDAVLLHRARAGDTAAFGALYSAHLAAARRLARSMLADPSDADDVVAEVFAASFAATKQGRGPVDDFRSYLLTSVRRECQRAWRRGARQRPGGNAVVALAAARPTGRDAADAVAEEELVRRAFAALPPRMQHVLWLTEVEGQPHDVVAERLGTSATAVAQLAHRARRQFGTHYLDGHLTPPDDGCPEACADARRVLAEVVRGTAGRRARKAADAHLAACASCAAAHAELEVVNARLRSALTMLPAVVAAHPVRIGLLTRLAAWATGPVPAMSAAATIAVATAVVPVVHDPATRHLDDRAEVVPAAPAPTPATPAEPVLVVDLAEDLVVTSDAGPAARGGDDLTLGLLPVDPVLVPAAEGAADTPTEDVPSPTEDAQDAAPTDGAAGGEPAPVPTSPTSPGDATAPPPPAAGPSTPPAGNQSGPALGPLPDVTGAVEDVVNGITLDDPVVAAVTPVVAALPEVGVAVTVPPVQVLTPAVTTPSVGLGVNLGGGEVGVGVDLGSAHIGVNVGPQGGATVQLPTVPEVVDQLPIVPGLLNAVPLTRNLLGGG